MSITVLPSRSRLARGLAIALMSAASAVALVPAAASAATAAIVTDSGCSTTSLPLNDDQSSNAIPLSSTLKFYDRSVSTAFVNNNGNITFGEAMGNYTGDIATLPNPLVAPFFSDLDTRSTGVPVTYGTTTYAGRPALCANWVGVGFYNQGTSTTNDFQALLVDRSDLQAGDFDVVLNYGRVDGDYGGDTQIGFSSADGDSGHVYVFPGSYVPGAFLDSNPQTGLVHGSRESSVLGRYVFRFRAGFPVGVTPPNTTIATGPATPSNDASPSFTYASSAAAGEHNRFECRVTAEGAAAGAFETCPDAGRTYDGLSDGTYTFEVRAVDIYLSTDSTPASATFTIDTTGPDTTLSSGPAALGNDTTASFTYTGTPAGEVAGFECRVAPAGGTAGEFAACDAEGFTTSELADGSYTFEVRSLDTLGNPDATPASYDFAVDTTPSVATIDTAPAALGNETTVDFTYSAAPSVDVDRFECRLLGAGPVELATCDDAGQTYADLVDGDYTFEVRAVDTAANTGAIAAYDFTVDTVAADTLVTSGPDTPDNSSSVSFTYAADPAGDADHFECRLVGAEPAEFAACDADGASYAELADGDYTFEVRAVDAAGNTDATPATHAFRVDTAAPDTRITSAPAATITTSSATFGYASDDEGAVTYECRLAATGVDGTWDTCPAEGRTFTGLADGGYQFDVRATDAAGNTDATAALHKFDVDTTPSVTTIDSAPVALSNETTATFTYSAAPSADVDRFECRLVGAGPAELTTCDDGGQTYTELVDGGYTFEVRAVDTAGNTGPVAAYGFTVETVPGGTEVTSGPRALGNDTTPSFTYASDAEDFDLFECRLLGAVSRVAFEHCDDAGTTYGPLSDGSYVFEVRSVDLAGNADMTPARQEFTVDTAAPQTSITEAPVATVNTSSVTFGFASDSDPSTFECRLSAGGQAAAWQSCSGTSKTFTGLADGTYTFEVRATDGASNTDTTPATGAVEVNVGKPTITASITSAHPITTAGWYRDTVTITYTCAGNGSALVGACPAPREVPRAQRGRNTFKASVTTADGDTASVSTKLFIDKGRPSLTIKGFSGTEVLSSVPKPRCKASDPRSGLDDCTIKVTKVTRKNGDRFIVVRAKATDLAGNVRIVTKKAPFRAA